MPSLPSPFRAAVGLIATVADEARNFPDKAIELPMLAVSTALQVSLRAQQRYAQLTARGDEILNSTPTTDEAPPWATFDEPVLDEPVLDEAVLDDFATEEADAEAIASALDEAGEDVAPPAKAQPRPRKTTRKTVTRPRTTPTGKASAFDAVGEE
jgi:hypothetical protein